MANAEVGQRVRVHYSGKLEDGSEFDSSEDDGPMELTIGEGRRPARIRAGAGRHGTGRYQDYSCTGR